MCERSLTTCRQTHEIGLASKTAEEKAEETRQTNQKIAEAVQFAEAQHVTHTRSLVAFLALSTVLSTPIPSGELGDHRLPSDESEKTAVIEAGRTLLTPEFGSGEKDDLLKGLLGINTDGSFEGLTC